MKLIDQFLRRLDKANTAGNGYPADRVLPSNDALRAFGKEVLVMAEEREGAIDWCKQLHAENETLRGEIKKSGDDSMTVYDRNGKEG